jgi:hypothetical protein
VKRIVICALAMLCGPMAGLAHADHPADGQAVLTAAALERAVGPGAERTNAGLFKVPIADGSVVRTHGPDARMDDSASLVAGGPSVRFLPGSAERAPICATDHSMQVLYARTDTTPDAFATSVPTIRSTVRRSNHVLNEEAIASGGGGGDYKVVCSGGEIDVKQFTTTGTSFSQVVSSAQSAGYTSAQRNYVVFLDSSGGGVCGVGSLYFSDSPGLSNPHNTNGGYSVIYNGCWSGTTFMHEVGHNRGAVQPAAPNSTGNGAHCNDGNDVMCYAPDGGNKNQSMTWPCPTTTLFDCGYNDYFDAAPEPGEYLSAHWNLGTQGQNFVRITEAGPPGPEDTTPPDTSISSGPRAKSRKKNATFAFTGVDETTAADGLTFECSVDFAAFAPCASPQTYSTVNRGLHHFEVLARDEAGNADPSPAAFEWKVKRSR